MSDLVVIGKETLTPVEFQKLADVPPEIEWRANITNPKTRRFYKNDVAEFLSFTGPQTPRRCAPWRGRMSSPGARI